MVRLGSTWSRKLHFRWWSLDESFDDEEDGSTVQKVLSPHRRKSKSPSKTTVRKLNQQPKSSSTPSNVLGPLKSNSSQTSTIQRSMQSNPWMLVNSHFNWIFMIASGVLNVVHHLVLIFLETIYCEISDFDVPITTEDATFDLSKVAKDLNPYSSIYAEPLPLISLKVLQ